MLIARIHIPNFFLFFHPLFLSLSSRQSFPLENVTGCILSYSVSHLNEGTEKLRTTCADTNGHLTVPISRLQSMKNDLSLGVPMCRPLTGGHLSKYWQSAKLLDLMDDRLEPKTYHTPNAVGNHKYKTSNSIIKIFCICSIMFL